MEAQQLIETCDICYYEEEPFDCTDSNLTKCLKVQMKHDRK